jgi:hypothetical protein
VGKILLANKTRKKEDEVLVKPLPHELGLPVRVGGIHALRETGAHTAATSTQKCNNAAKDSCAGTTGLSR